MLQAGKILLLGVALMLPLSVFADAPPSLDVPDSDSDVQKGKLTVYRVQIKDMDFGPKNDLTNNELFITLDSTGDAVYTLDLHDDSPKVNFQIAQTLMEAYLHGSVVTIHSSKFVKAGGAAKIHVVQMDKRK